MKYWMSLLILICVLGVSITGEAQEVLRLRGVPFDAVKVTDAFWGLRIEINRVVSIPHCIKMCEETGLVDNFAKAAGLMKGDAKGIWFSDAQVYKTIEGISFSLALHYDADLDRFLDGLIDKIAAAQEADGYINSHKTIKLKSARGTAEDPRWSNLSSGLELYVCGHLYEAAAANYRATGKRKLLEVAIKNANLVARLFGVGERRDVGGHQEVEVGLVKLYQATGEDKYLKLVKFFIDERGRSHGRKLRGPFSQDHKPIVEQREAVGQAPRATYFYSGVTDVAAITGQKDYAIAMEKIWEDVVSKKMYITGGIGSLHENEGFGEAYELPNKTAYAETCAAISFSMWNYRMFLLLGEAKFIDVLELTVYNNFPAGVSLKGDTFFYANPLESDGIWKFNRGYVGEQPYMYKEGSATRKPWFYCPCCPPNAIRFVPQIAGYMYAQRGKTVYINFFIDSDSVITLQGHTVRLKQKTRYPWDGKVKITVEPEQPQRFAINVRIPGWARGRPVPSDLYRYLNESSEEVTLKVNDRSIALNMRKGFAHIERKWDKGDVIELDLPMQVRRVAAHEKVKDDRGKVALQRGPIVYCLEEVDNGKDVRKVCLTNKSKLTTQYRGELLGGVVVVKGSGTVRKEDERQAKEVEFTAVPYYSWNNREAGQMVVWLKWNTAQLGSIRRSSMRNL